MQNSVQLELKEALLSQNNQKDTSLACFTDMYKN